MRRILFIIAGVVLLAWSGLSRPPVVAQSRKAQATIDALQTRVAELEQQLGLTSTPGPAPQDPLDGPVTALTSSDQRTVAGNVLDLLPAGDPDSVGVIAVGPYARFNLGLSLPVVVRNTTSAGVEHVQVAATAYNAEGKLLASGQDRNITPWSLAPGEVAFGYVDFDGIDLPADTVFDFTVTSNPARSPEDLGVLDYEILEVSSLDNRLVGQVRNPTGKSMSSSHLSAACFDDDGQILSYYFASINPDRVDPGQTATFQVLIDAEDPCPRFLVAAMGFAI